MLNWNVNPETLAVYKHNIDFNLQSTKIPWNALYCEKNQCHECKSRVVSFYNKLLDVLLISAIDSILSVNKSTKNVVMVILKRERLYLVGLIMLKVIESRLCFGIRYGLIIIG